MWTSPGLPRCRLGCRWTMVFVSSGDKLVYGINHRPTSNALLRGFCVDSLFCPNGKSWSRQVNAFIFSFNSLHTSLSMYGTLYLIPSLRWALSGNQCHRCQEATGLLRSYLLWYHTSVPHNLPASRMQFQLCSLHEFLMMMMVLEGKYSSVELRLGTLVSKYSA